VWIYTGIALVFPNKTAPNDCITKVSNRKNRAKAEVILFSLPAQFFRGGAALMVRQLMLLIKAITWPNEAFSRT
jgi:hypothetical protein